MFTHRFPQVVSFLNGKGFNDALYEDEMFAGSNATLEDVKKWIDKQPSTKAPKGKIGCKNLEAPIVQLIQDEVAKVCHIAHSAKDFNPSRMKTPNYLFLTLKRPRGGGWINPPLNIFRDHSAARNFLTAPLTDFLLSSLAHLMTPFSRKSGIPLRRCTTFYTSSSDQKWLKNVILCTKSMQMEFSHLIHKDMIIFTFIGWNQFILA